MDGAHTEAELEVRFFGDGEVRVAGVTMRALASPRIRSLLAYLVLGRAHPLGRQKLAFLFWPDSNERQARTNLRQALHHLRHALGSAAECVHVDNQSVQWVATREANVDVVRFEECARAGLEDHDEEALAQAAAVYQGDLLEGCFDDWILSERDRLRAMAGAVLRRMLEIAWEGGHSASSIAFGERLLRLDPLDESTYRRLMELHAAVGDRARAVRIYHEGVAALDRELGVSPDATTVELYERVVAASAALVGVVDDGLVPAMERSALVGREREMERLISAWRHCALGRAQFALVTGEPGIGKSHLVEHFRAWCSHNGVSSVAAGRTRPRAGCRTGRSWKCCERIRCGPHRGVWSRHGVASSPGWHRSCRVTTCHRRRRNATGTGGGCSRRSGAPLSRRTGRWS